MKMSDYNNLFKKIKDFGEAKINPISKIERLKEILEDFEREHNVFATGIFSKEGLEIMTAFQKDYINREQLGAYGTKHCYTGIEFMEKIFSEPTTVQIVEKMLKSNIGNVKAELKCIILDIFLDSLSLPIIISPIPAIGLIIMVAKGRENLALIKMNLDKLKRAIQDSIIN